MPLRSFSADLCRMDFIGKSTQRGKLATCCTVPSSGAVSDDFSVISDCDGDSLNQSCWANLPPELLRNVLQRVEAADCTWPARKDVVSCSAVCKSWRAITMELVTTPEESGKLTFPISLKQPGPRERTMQCFIKRDKANSMFFLYLGLSPTAPTVEHSKFLLAARRYRRASCIEYIISLDPEDTSTRSNAFVGKLRSNFLGTKFRVYDTYAIQNATPVSNRHLRCIGSHQVCPKPPTGNYYVAHVGYQLNILGARGPRRMICTLYSIPLSVLEGDNRISESEESKDITNLPSPIAGNGRLSLLNQKSKATSKVSDIHGPLVLKNKSPRWHEQLQCWCLNFRGRVTVASVKNFQLVASVDSSITSISQSEQEKVLVQFGKIGKDMFTMDYRYPLSAFQAFAICLTSFGTKLACE